MGTEVQQVRRCSLYGGRGGVEVCSEYKVAPCKEVLSATLKCNFNSLSEFKLCNHAWNIKVNNTLIKILRGKVWAAADHKSTVQGCKP